MRVAVVSPYSLDHPGGVQSQVVELVERLRQEGEDAWVVAPGAGGEREGLRLVGGAVRVPANGSLAPLSLTPAVLGRVRRAVAGADLIHIHEPLMPLVSWAALRSSQPKVLTFHSDPSRFMRTMLRLGAPGLRLLVRRAAAVTAVSPLAASAVDRFASDVTIIPNGLDTSSYRSDGVDRRPQRVAFLGRDDPRKGLDVLLAAWPVVRESVPGAELRVMGAEGRSEPGLTYLGRVDEPTKRVELAGSAVFCAPNRGGESFGITVVEGMAAGCAVIASDLPAFRAVGGDAIDLARVGDAGALAAAIVGRLREPDAARARGEAAADAAARFDWSTVVPAYRRLYAAAPA